MFEFQNTLHKNIFEFTVNTDFETISYFTRQPSSAMENSPPDLCDSCTGIISILGIHMCEVGPFFISIYCCQQHYTFRPYET